MTERFQGVVVGLVTDIEDPQGLGRVKVSFPWLADGMEESQWARVARPMAGDDYGHWLMPEVDDEALVCFEHGDFQFPYVIGFLWNGRARPPVAGEGFSLRRVKTVSGHVLDFDDRSGEEKVRLETQGGNVLELNDVDGEITLETSGGVSIKMKDLSGSIELRTPGGNVLEIKDTPPGVSLTTTGSISVNALRATVSAMADATLTAPVLRVDSALVTFSGVVQTQTLITNAVVSTTYTPGVGNLI